jgi:hypothetical protein
MVMDLVYVQKGKNGEQSSMRCKVTKKIYCCKTFKGKDVNDYYFVFGKKKYNGILSYLVLN